MQKSPKPVPSAAKTMPAPDKEPSAPAALPAIPEPTEQTDSSPVQEAASAQETGASDRAEDSAGARETRGLAPSGKRAEKDPSYIRPVRNMAKP